jgi:hypothetical protein
MPKRILDLNETLNIDAGEDVLPIVRDGETKKITAYNLLRYADNFVYQGTDVKLLTAGWESTRSIVQQNSAITWNYQGNDIKALSGQWDNTTSLFRFYSSGWIGVETSFNLNAPLWTYWTNLVESRYTLWDEVHDVVIQDGFANNWNSVYSTVLSNSTTNWLNKPIWDQAYNVVQSNSSLNWNNKSTWDDVYNVVQANSAINWNINTQTVVATVQANSATNWNNELARAFTQTFFLPRSGGAITQNLWVSGDISTSGRILSAGVDIHTLFGSGGGEDVTLTYLHNGFLPLSGGTMTGILQFTNSNSTPVNFKIESFQNQEVRLYTEDLYPIVFTTGRNEDSPEERSLYIDTDGNTSIGNVNPSEKLHVSGNIISENGLSKITAKSTSPIQTAEIKAEVTSSKNVTLKQYGATSGGNRFGLSNNDSGGLYGDGLNGLLVSLNNNNPVIIGNNTSTIRVGEGYVSINNSTTDLSATLAVRQVNATNPILKLNDAGNNTQFIVGKNGNVGIRTDSPDINFELTVNGSITAQNLVSNNLETTNLSASLGEIHTFNATNSYIANSYFINLSASNIENGINIFQNDYNNLLLFSSYTKQPNNNVPEIGLFTITDGKTFNKILNFKVSDLLTTVADVHSDSDSPSIIYYNGRYLIAIGASNNTIGQQTDCVIISTNNFNLTNPDFNISLDLGTKLTATAGVRIISPKWFLHDGNLYLIYTHVTGGGSPVRSVRYSQVTNIEDTVTGLNISFSASTIIKSSSARSGNIFKYENLLYLIYVNDSNSIVIETSPITDPFNPNFTPTIPNPSILTGSYKSPSLLPYVNDFGNNVYRLFFESINVPYQKFYANYNIFNNTFGPVQDGICDTRSYGIYGINLTDNVKPIIDLLASNAILTKPLEDPFSKRSVKAWGLVQGDTGTLIEGYNCNSSGGAGSYTISLTGEPLLNTNAAVIVNVNRAGASGQNVVVSSTSSITITTYDDITSVTAPTSFSFVVYGN